MIVYRVELWCDGCMAIYPRWVREHGYLDIAARSADVLKHAQRNNGWLADAGAHFCPKCQIQRHGVAQQADAEQTLQALKSKIIQ